MKHSTVKVKSRLINEFNNEYKIFSDGRIWSCKTNRFLKQCLTNDGYAMVYPSISGKKLTKHIHRIVASYFVKGKTKLRNQVNHIDGNKLNNDMSNLEWTTPKENVNHAWATGLNQNYLYQGEDCRFSLLTEKEVVEIKKLLMSTSFNGTELGKKFNIHRSAIYGIKMGLTWTHIHVPGWDSELMKRTRSTKKLTDLQVLEIKQILIDRAYTDMTELGARFGVTKSMISKINTGNSRTNLTKVSA